MNAVFVGEKRSGKTTLAFHMAVEAGGGVIVFDPKKEFRDWPATVSSIDGLEKAIAGKHRIIIWRPGEQEDARDSFDALADWILSQHAKALANGWDRDGRHFTLLVDEAYNLQTHAWIDAKLMKILSECRPEVLNVFQTFQSVKNVNSDSRSRVSDWYVFTITLPSDLKRLEEFAMPEVVAEVPTLNEHEYVHFINEKGKVSSTTHTDSETWFRSLDYSENNENAREETMARRESNKWEPVSFETEDDFWDFASKRERRKGEDRDSGERERASDKRRRSSSRRDAGDGFAVYRKAS